MHIILSLTCPIYCLKQKQLPLDAFKGKHIGLRFPDFLERGSPIPKNSPLRKLNPILDSDGLVRTGGRLHHAPIEMEEKHPLIVPGRSHVACKELLFLQDDTNISKYLNVEGCIWLFNSPHSSHMGGVWERMIGTFRRILDSMLLKLNPSHLTHEVPSTLMAKVSAIIPARALTSVSSDAPLPLTPAMILMQKICTPLPPPGSFEHADLHRQQWRRVQHLANVFWEERISLHSSKLQQVARHTSKHPNIKEGDLVLLKDPLVTRNDWPMARVIKAHLDGDGKVRKLELKVTKGGTVKTFLRPVTEVVVLFMFSDVWTHLVRNSGIVCNTRRGV